MARIPPVVLRRYLSGGHLPTKGCLRMRGTPLSARPLCVPRCHTAASIRAVHTATEPLEVDVTIPFRKQLKEEAKRRKAEGSSKKANIDNQVLEEWELTVGIEIHAQLNTARKLFSSAASTINDEPNTHVALFDVAMPGSQPHFQKETLIPAIRAALALNCNFNLESRFDRKHYFHWDQPSGYQITQYYQPFATDGYITLYAHDGIAKEDGESVRIGIKQVQMEQDTAKTISQPGDIHLLDFNRVGLPLIEIITLPQIHYPSTAAALVRKIQIMLNAVDACVLGMESGGLRADVNVSVRRRDTDHEAQIHEYAGVGGLGQRTEIKNLSSFKAVEDAIIAERDRQIKVLEDGGKIEGETRGWSIGSSETRRLRGKEGEVDYRYMPDPDLPPLLIGSDLIDHLSQNLGVLPDEELNILTDDYGLTVKDAMTLVSLDDGGRVEYFRNVVDELLLFDKPRGTPHETANLAHADSISQSPEIKKAGRVVANWVLHEMGGLVLDSGEDASHLGFTSDGDCLISAQKLAALIYFLEKKSITGKTAKKLLVSLFENELEGTSKEVKDMIEEGGLWFRPMTEEEYVELARSVLDARVVEQILKGQKGKIMYLVGQMMRNGEDGRVDPQEAKRVIERVVEEYRS